MDSAKREFLRKLPVLRLCILAYLVVSVTRAFIVDSPIKYFWLPTAWILFVTVRDIRRASALLR